jgi:hypothetical protein
MYRTHHFRTTNNRIRNYHSLRRTKDEGKAFVSSMRMEDTSSATAIRKRTIIVSLEEKITQEYNTLKAELQGEHSELSRSWKTPLLVFPPIESYPEAQSK